MSDRPSMGLRRIVVNMPDGTVEVPLAFKRGTQPDHKQMRAHDRDGHIYEKGAVTVFGQVWICTVCGQMFLESEAP